MELVLIRHALPERQQIEGGRADPPLSQRGIEQARAAADWLRAEQIDAVYSSPMRRARETAEAYASLGGTASIELRDGLAEFDRHSDTYIPMEELKATDYAAWKAFVDGRYNAEVDILAFQDTVVRTLELLIAANPSRRVAAFCHGGVINVWTAHVLGMAPRLFFEPGYTSLHRYLCASTGERSVVSLNEMAHLRG